jgi:hypothetical protein
MTGRLVTKKERAIMVKVKKPTAAILLMAPVAVNLPLRKNFKGH